MRFPSKETVERVRREYPVGCRVELTHMDDAQAPLIGTKGTAEQDKILAAIHGVPKV